MEEAPGGSPVGVDDPYAFAGACDHLTDDGRCRFALAHAGADPAFAAARRADDYVCLAGADDADWRDCPKYRSTTDGRECVRCGIEEVRMAHDADRPLLEEHHLSYGSGSGASAGAAADADADATTDGDAGATDSAPAHEITVSLCRWCHAKVHNSIARIDDDAAPDPEAVAAREERRGREREEFGFRSARERREDGDGT
jgi:hypothetical protein